MEDDLISKKVVSRLLVQSRMRNSIWILIVFILTLAAAKIPFGWVIALIFVVYALVPNVKEILRLKKKYKL